MDMRASWKTTQEDIAMGTILFRRSRFKSAAGGKTLDVRPSAAQKAKALEMLVQWKSCRELRERAEARSIPSSLSAGLCLQLLAYFEKCFPRPQ